MAPVIEHCSRRPFQWAMAANEKDDPDVDRMSLRQRLSLKSRLPLLFQLLAAVLLVGLFFFFSQSLVVIYCNFPAALLGRICQPRKFKPDAGLYDRHYHPALPLHLIPLLFQYLPANIVHWFRLNFHDFFLTTGHRRGNVVT